MKKRLLMLGGAWAQIPAIKRAKQLGYYVITCDYLPNNAGHQFSDEYVNISTVEKETVLQYAEQAGIDGIIAYASDPSAVTAAYVSERLHLPGGCYDAVNMMSEKDRFRAFQREHGFQVPTFFSVTAQSELEKVKEGISFPCVVKPVDSSGSKGVTKVETVAQLDEAAALALSFSRCGRAIVEEYIPSPYCQLHGDGIVYNGRLIFAALGDQRFYNAVPIGTSFPSKIDSALLHRAQEEASRFIACSGYECGGVNIEIRVTAAGEIYILEIGPRTGGNYVPQLMRLATGEDEVTAALQIAMGETPAIRMPLGVNCCFQYIIGSRRNGAFQHIKIDEYTRGRLEELYVHKVSGDWLSDYHNSSEVVGVALIRFPDRQEMEASIGQIDRHIQVITKGGCR